MARPAPPLRHGPRIAMLAVLFAIATAAHAQFEVGVQSGISAGSLYRIKGSPGLGFFATGRYRWTPNLAFGLTTGVMLHAFSSSDFALVPPSSNQTFAARLIPIELSLRLSSAGTASDGGIVFVAGAAGVAYSRDTVVAHAVAPPGDTVVIAGISGFGVGFLLGGGYESPLLFGDALRLTLEGIAVLDPVTAATADGRFTYVVLRVGLLARL